MHGERWLTWTSCIKGIAAKSTASRPCPRPIHAPVSELLWTSSPRRTFSTGAGLKCAEQADSFISPP